MREAWNQEGLAIKCEARSGCCEEGVDVVVLGSRVDPEGRGPVLKCKWAACESVVQWGDGNFFVCVGFVKG